MSKVVFEDNPEYRLAFESKVHGKKFYVPVNLGNGYMMPRVIAAQAQSIYATCGATPELLGNIIDKIIACCNEGNTATVKSDVSVLANNIKYRLKYPVDEDASIRIGAILCFGEGEDPDTMFPQLTEEKVRLAKGDFLKDLPGDAALYAFFLSLGIEYLGSVIDLSSITVDTAYFEKRRKSLEGLIPQQ